MTLTVDTAQTRATSRDLFDLVSSGIQSGLPVPEQLNFYHFCNLYLIMGHGDTEAVVRWAAYLALPRPRMATHIHPATKDGAPPWRMYRSGGYEVLLGWSADVCCRVDLTAEEIAALPPEVVGP